MQISIIAMKNLAIPDMILVPQVRKYLGNKTLMAGE
jgi:hypothetical protein